MPKIIVATDFSPIAQNAATYAAHLARYLQYDIVLFHAYIVAFAYADSAVPLLNEDQIKDISQTSMAHEKQRLHTLEPSLFIEEKIVPGDFIESLQEEINQNAYDLIIMGTSGDDADSIMWGSMAVRALRSFSIPVLTIPAKADWKPLDKICFAADYHKISDNTPFQDILKWANQTHSQLSVVHIDAPAQQKIQPPEILKTALSEKKPTYHSVSTDQIVEGVHAFIAQNQMDWLILIPKKYGFWASLFHRSRTKMLTQVSHIPILALHED